VCYHSHESVTLALTILDGGYIRIYDQISVKIADFTSATSANDSAAVPNNAEDKGRKSTKDGKGKRDSSRAGATSDRVNVSKAKVAHAAQRQALSWNEDDDGGGYVRKCDKIAIVVLEHAFDPVALAGMSEDDRMGFLSALETKVASECCVFGTIEKITVYSRHPRGVVIVRFASNYGAQQCKEGLAGRRWLEGSDGECMRTSYFDGVTDYSTVVIPAKEEEEGENKKMKKKEQEQEGTGDYDRWLEQYDEEELPPELRVRIE
jgi:hypothetical protein